MDRMLELARGVFATLASPSVSVYWGYLASAGVLALAVWWRRTSATGRSLRGALSFLFPGQVWRHRSAWHDLAIFVINTVLYSLLLLPLLSGVSIAVGNWTWAALLRGFGAHAWHLHGALATALMTIALVLAADLAFFVSHWLQHRIGWLWAFHQVHHSAPVLQPFTVFRRHPVDVCIEGAITGALLGVVYGTSGFIAGAVVDAHTILGVNVVLFVFLLAGFNLQHSHVWLTFGRLGRVFISPAAHQIHHSTAPEHRDRNLGNMLSIWDRLAGTYIAPAARGRVTVGLGEAEDRRFRSLWRLYLVPCVDAARAIGRAGNGLRGRFHYIRRR